MLRIASSVAVAFIALDEIVPEHVHGFRGRSEGHMNARSGPAREHGAISKPKAVCLTTVLTRVAAAKARASFGLGARAVCSELARVAPSTFADMRLISQSCETSSSSECEAWHDHEGRRSIGAG